MINVTLLQPGMDNTSVEVDEGTTVAAFLEKQNLAGHVYRNGPEAQTDDILSEGDQVLVIGDRSVKGA